MALTIDDFDVADLSSLDAEDVSQLLTRLATQIQELNPSIDLKRGAFRDTLLYLHAVLEAAIRTNIDQYQAARSLLQVTQNPETANTAIVDNILSNWGITRQEGSKATGPVTIELAKLRSVVIPQGTEFTANGNTYVADNTYVSRTSVGQVATDTDKLLTQLSNGNWVFVINVEAENVGATYKLNAGELIQPTQSITSYVSSYATSDFSNGVDTETNTALINKLQEGVSAKVLSNRTNMRAWLRSLSDYSSVTNQSIVGYGDAEMLRDQHTIFPVSYGGRVDWYIRGQEALQQTAFTFSATLVEVAGSTSTWQFSIDKDKFPGFYEVTKINRVEDAATTSSFGIVSDTRGTDLTGTGFIPDIANTQEGAFTAYQTATIKFEDTVTDTTTLSLGDTADYTVQITGVPHIAAIQDLVASRDIRSYAADALIKAPVPCFVSVALTINKKAGDASPDTDAIKTAIMQVINQTEFIGRLDGSRIIEKVHEFISGNTSVTKLNLLGRIRRPDNSLIYMSSAESLIVTPQPDEMVTANTVQFFSTTDNIIVDVQTSIPTAG